jgi:hypothetical protein
MNASRPPISPKLTCRGLFYIPRMCDKIRLFEAACLPADYHANLGLGMDLWTCRFLHVDYNELRAKVAAGLGDDEVLDWCFTAGRRPNEFETGMFNEFLSKKGFRDGLSERLAQRKAEAGAAARDDIQTFFDYIDMDEGRL